MAFALAAGVITQTGIDANPEGLSAIAGVTTINKGNATTKRIVYDLGTLRLDIAGDLTHDPDVYEIIGNIQNGIRVIAGASYKYGIERIINGRKTYSKGTGLVSTYQGDFFSLFGIVLSGGTMTWNGGIIRTTGAISHSACVVTSNSFDSVWQNVGTSGQWRSSGTPDFKNVTMQGVNADCVLFLLGGWTSLSVNFERAYYQTPVSGGATRTIQNAVFANNQAYIDAVSNQSVEPQQLTIIKNPDVLPRLGKLSTNAYVNFEVTENLVFNVANSSGVSASNVIAYVADSNNGFRKNATANGLPSGTVTQNYVNDRKYIATSNASGVASLGDILTLVATHNNLTDGTINLDYRSNYGNGSVDFNVYLGGYEYLQAVTKQSLIGNNGKSVLWTMFDDSNVTLTRANALAKLASSFTVNPTTKIVTVTANSTYDDLYDALKAWKYNGTQINAETPTTSNLILTANGVELTAFTGWTLVVNTGITLSAGTKFTYVKFDTVTNNGTITGVYANSTGTSTTWQFQDVEVGTSLVIYDGSGVTKYFQGEVTSAGTYSYYIPPQSSATTYFYAIEKYGTRREEGSFPNNAGGVLFYVPSYAEDVGITQTTKATVSAYTDIDNLDKFYDYTAFKRLSENFIKLGQIATRNGTAVDIGDYSLVVNQSSGAVESVTGTVVTIKSSSLANGSKFTLITATPPATVTANSTEVITASIEDANGDSSVTIQGGSGDFTLWKITNATSEDDYATGTNLGNVTNTTFRFLQASGFKIVIRDNITSFRQVVPMDKGIYVRGLFFGDQVQLAQSAEVTQINSKVDLLQTELGQVMMSFDVSTDSLHAISDAVDLLPTLTEMEASTILAKEASVQEIITKVDAIDVSALATQVSVDALGAPLQAVDYVAPDNTTISEIKVLVEAIEPTDLTTIELDLERIEKNTKTIIGLTA